MSESSRSLLLLDQLENALDHMTARETDLARWQALAQQRRRQLDRLERRTYRLATHCQAERDGLRQERDAAQQLLAQCLVLLLPVLQADSAPVDVEALQTLFDATVLLLKDSRFLDTVNLDSPSSDICP